MTRSKPGWAIVKLRRSRLDPDDWYAHDRLHTINRTLTAQQVSTIAQERMGNDLVGFFHAALDADDRLIIGNRIANQDW